MITNDSLFQTTDNRSVICHGGQNKLLYPDIHKEFRGWAYRNVMQISMITSEFIDKTGFETYISYYPCLTIWSECGKDTLSYVLLQNYEEQIPRFCFCWTDWKPIECKNEKTCDFPKVYEEKGTPYNPIRVQFLEIHSTGVVTFLFDKTLDTIKQGLSIRPVDVEPDLFSRDEIMIDNSKMAISLSFQSEYFSPEISPILNEWKSLFFSIRKEVGILPSNPPCISHNRSVYELYQKAVEKRT